MPKKSEVAYSHETEFAYLNCVMVKPDLLDDPETCLIPQDFFSEKARFIYDAIIHLKADGVEMIETFGILEYLKKTGKDEWVGGIAGIAEIEKYNLGNENVRPYIRIIREMKGKRELQKAALKVEEIANDPTAATSDQIDAAERALATAKAAAAPPVPHGKKKTMEPDREYPTCPGEAFFGPAEFYRKAFEQTTNASHNYHIAGYLTMTGILLGKSVLTQEGGDDIYPNLFTVIVGKAGFARKDSANNRAVKYLRAVDPDVAIVETIGSIEQFIGYCQNRQQELLKESQYDGPFRVVLRFRELQGLIAKASQKATSNIWSKLCELYDCPDELTTAVKHDNAVVKNPVGGILAATSPGWLKNMQSDDLEAGPGRRIIWVPGDPGPRIKNRQPPNRQYLAPLIEIVKKYVDEYRRRAEPTVIPFDIESLDYLNTWAEKHESRVSGNDIIDSLTAGDEVAVRKVALIHAATHGAVEITIEHVRAAIAFTEFLYDCRFPAFSQHGLTVFGEIEVRILKKVESSMPLGISWRDLRRYQQRIPIEDFNRVMNALTRGVDPDLKVTTEFGKAWVKLVQG